MEGWELTACRVSSTGVLQGFCKILYIHFFCHGQSAGLVEITHTYMIKQWQCWLIQQLNYTCMSDLLLQLCYRDSLNHTISRTCTSQSPDLTHHSQQTLSSEQLVLVSTEKVKHSSKIGWNFWQAVLKALSHSYLEVVRTLIHYTQTYFEGTCSGLRL